MDKKNKVDLFISYRRDGGVDYARMIYLELRRRGYNVFFDYNSLRDGKFNDAIFKAIDQCEYFILVLTNEALSRCANASDWVREEICYALKNRKPIVPICPSGHIRDWPAELPQCLESLRNIQISTLQLDDLFEKSFDKVVEDRFENLRPLVKESSLDFEGKSSDRTFFLRRRKFNDLILIGVFTIMGVLLVTEIWDHLPSRKAESKSVVVASEPIYGKKEQNLQSPVRHLDSTLENIGIAVMIIILISFPVLLVLCSFVNFQRRLKTFIGLTGSIKISQEDYVSIPCDEREVNLGEFRPGVLVVYGIHKSGKKAYVRAALSDRHVSCVSVPQREWLNLPERNLDIGFCRRVHRLVKGFWGKNRLVLILNVEDPLEKSPVQLVQLVNSFYEELSKIAPIGNRLAIVLKLVGIYALKGGEIEAHCIRTLTPKDCDTFVEAYRTQYKDDFEHSVTLRPTHFRELEQKKILDVEGYQHHLFIQSHMGHPGDLLSYVKGNRCIDRVLQSEHVMMDEWQQILKTGGEVSYSMIFAVMYLLAILRSVKVDLHVLMESCVLDAQQRSLVERHVKRLVRNLTGANNIREGVLQVEPAFDKIDSETCAFIVHMGDYGEENVYDFHSELKVVLRTFADSDMFKMPEIQLAIIQQWVYAFVRMGKFQSLASSYIVFAETFCTKGNGVVWDDFASTLLNYMLDNIVVPMMGIRSDEEVRRVFLELIDSLRRSCSRKRFLGILRILPFLRKLECDVTKWGIFDERIVQQACDFLAYEKSLSAPDGVDAARQVAAIFVFGAIGLTQREQCYRFDVEKLHKTAVCLQSLRNVFWVEVTEEDREFVKQSHFVAISYTHYQQKECLYKPGRHVPGRINGRTDRALANLDRFLLSARNVDKSQVMIDVCCTVADYLLDSGWDEMHDFNSATNGMDRMAAFLCDLEPKSPIFKNTVMQTLSWTIMRCNAEECSTLSKMEQEVKGMISKCNSNENGLLMISPVVIRDLMWFLAWKIREVQSKTGITPELRAFCRDTIAFLGKWFPAVNSLERLAICRSELRIAAFVGERRFIELVHQTTSELCRIAERRDLSRRVEPVAALEMAMNIMIAVKDKGPYAYLQRHESVKSVREALMHMRGSGIEKETTSRMVPYCWVKFFAEIDALENRMHDDNVSL